MTDTNQHPIHDLPKEDRKVVTVDLVAADWLLLKGCDLTHGSLTTTFNTLVSKLANECRKRGIIDFSRSEEFRQLVQSITFSVGDTVSVSREELDELRIQSTEYQRILSAGGLRNRTTPRSPRKTDGRNVGRRTSRKSNTNTSTSNPAGLQSGGGSGDTTSKRQAVSGEVGETSS